MLKEVFNIERIMGFCEKICYFFAVNLLFILFNIPVLLFFLFVGASQIRTCLPLFLCSLIPSLPALSAVLYCMNRILEGTENSAGKDFLRGFRMDVFQKFRLSAVQMAMFLIFWTNIEFFARQVVSLPLTILSIAAFAFAVLMAPNLCLVMTRYSLGSLAALRTAALLTIVKPVHTLGTVAALGLTLVALELQPAIAMFFAASLYGFLVIFMSRRLMDELEGRCAKNL